MKNRDRQRVNRRIKGMMLSVANEYGVADPTPYEAVKEYIRELRKKEEKRYDM